MHLKPVLCDENPTHDSARSQRLGVMPRERELGGERDRARRERGRASMASQGSASLLARPGWRDSPDGLLAQNPYC